MYYVVRRDRARGEGAGLGGSNVGGGTWRTWVRPLIDVAMVGKGTIRACDAER
jgi:hypothetical protein